MMNEKVFRRKWKVHYVDLCGWTGETHEMS